VRGDRAYTRASHAVKLIDTRPASRTLVTLRDSICVLPGNMPVGEVSNVTAVPLLCVTIEWGRG
jgi:hypothetical protein